MSKIKKLKTPTAYATFHDLAKAWQLRADTLRFGAEHAAANNVEACAQELAGMAGINLVRPTMIAYVWKDLVGIGGRIEMQVGFHRPIHIPVEAITVLRGPPIPEQDFVTGANIDPTDTRRLSAILDLVKDWKGLRSHWNGLKTEEGAAKALAITEAIDNVEKVIITIKDKT